MINANITINHNFCSTIIPRQQAFAFLFTQTKKFPLIHNFFIDTKFLEHNFFHQYFYIAITINVVMATSIITTQQFLIQNLVAEMYQILSLNQINWINKTTNIKISIETPSITQHFTKIETPQYPTCTNLHSTFKVVRNEQFHIHDKTIKLTYIFQITSFNNTFS